MKQCHVDCILSPQQSVLKDPDASHSGGSVMRGSAYGIQPATHGFVTDQFQLGYDSMQPASVQFSEQSQLLPSEVSWETSPSRSHSICSQHYCSVPHQVKAGLLQQYALGTSSNTAKQTVYRGSRSKAAARIMTRITCKPVLFIDVFIEGL